MQGLLGNYSDLLALFGDAGYKYSFFTDTVEKNLQLILRHDIDFSLVEANKISMIEDALGIKSTYFILLRSNFYNILSKENLSIIHSLKARGHQIGIHFDSSLYGGESLSEGLDFEINLFRHLFDEPVEIIAPHRPDQIFLENTVSLDGIQHTYDPKFFKDIKYIADSTGRFRYEKPQDFIDLGSKQSLQLNLHPIWWSGLPGNSPLQVIYSFLQAKKSRLDFSMEENFTGYESQ